MIIAVDDDDDGDVPCGLEAASTNRTMREERFCRRATTEEEDDSGAGNGIDDDDGRAAVVANATRIHPPIIFRPEGEKDSHDDVGFTCRTANYFCVERGERERENAGW